MMAIPMARPRRRTGMARVLDRNASDNVEVGLSAKGANIGD
jgi:hypothetical protein